MQYADFSHAELAETAQANVTGFILVTIGFCQSRGIAYEDWAQYVATSFAPGWDPIRGQGALPVAREAALNLASGGARGVQVSGDESRAMLQMHWPTPEQLTFVGINQEDADRTLETFFANIARHLDLGFEQRREGQTLHMVFTR